MTTLPNILRHPPALPSMDEVVVAAAHVCAVTLPEFYGAGRDNRLVLAREIAAAAMRRFRDCSWHDIARALRNASHTTALLAWQRYQRDEYKPVTIGNGTPTTRHALVDRTWDHARQAARKRIESTPATPDRPDKPPPEARTTKCPCCRGKGWVPKETAEAFSKWRPDVPTSVP